MAQRYQFANEETDYVLSNRESRELIHILEIARLSQRISAEKLERWIAMFRAEDGDGHYELIKE